MGFPICVPAPDLHTFTQTVFCCQTCGCRKVKTFIGKVEIGYSPFDTKGKECRRSFALRVNSKEEKVISTDNRFANVEYIFQGSSVNDVLTRS